MMLEYLPIENGINDIYKILQTLKFGIIDQSEMNSILFLWLVWFIFSKHAKNQLVRCS